MGEYTKVNFKHYDVSISYKCPICGARHEADIEPWEIYWMLECSHDVVCDECGETLGLTCDEEVEK